MADLNYFVFTLGQALESDFRTAHSFENINIFLDHQAKVIPDRLAVGFPVPVPNDQEWRVNLVCMYALYPSSYIHLISP